MIPVESIKTLTFDCYGTLIDWETGIRQSLKPLLSKYKITIDNDRLLEKYAEYESELEKGTYKPYKIILHEVLLKFADEFSFKPTPEELKIFSHAPSKWRAFEDSSCVLKKLQKQFELVIISNIDRDLFSESEKKLGVKFNQIITAEDVKAYKPSLAVFNYALNRINSSKNEILHIAQSKYHDIAPARELGINTIWVNRRKDQPGSGATPQTTIKPSFEVVDLNSVIPLLIR